MKANLSRRLQALEEARPDPQETGKARMHTQARMIVEDPEACDQANNLFESTVLGGRDGEVEDFAARLDDRLRLLEVDRVQG